MLLQFVNVAIKDTVQTNKTVQIAVQAIQPSPRMMTDFPLCCVNLITVVFSAQYKRLAKLCTNLKFLVTIPEWYDKPWTNQVGDIHV